MLVRVIESNNQERIGFECTAEADEHYQKQKAIYSEAYVDGANRVKVYDIVVKENLKSLWHINDRLEKLTIAKNLLIEGTKVKLWIVGTPHEHIKYFLTYLEATQYLVKLLLKVTEDNEDLFCISSKHVYSSQVDEELKLSEVWSKSFEEFLSS
jgi:hypothetical protein